MIKLKGKTCNKPHIYKITNDVNGKFYYGVHNGSNTEMYESTSKLLKTFAYEKYGKENFTKEILMWFDTVKEAYEYERVIVNQQMVDNPQCYNIKLGGSGGFDHLNSDVDHQRMAGHISYNKMKEEKSGLLSTESIEKSVETKRKNGIYNRIGKQNVKYMHKHIECPYGCGYKNNSGNVGKHKKKCKKNNNKEKIISEEENKK